MAEGFPQRVRFRYTTRSSSLSDCLSDSHCEEPLEEMVVPLSSESCLTPSKIIELVEARRHSETMDLVSYIRASVQRKVYFGLPTMKPKSSMGKPELQISPIKPMAGILKISSALSYANCTSDKQPEMPKNTEAHGIDIYLPQLDISESKEHSSKQLPNFENAVDKKRLSVLSCRKFSDHRKEQGVTGVRDRAKSAPPVARYLVPGQPKAAHPATNSKRSGRRPRRLYHQSPGLQPLLLDQESAIGCPAGRAGAISNRAATFRACLTTEKQIQRIRQESTDT